MKITFVTLLITMLTLSVWAVPAKKGQWRNLRLSDGTEVRAMLIGDEHGHYWKAEDGTTYIAEEGTVFYRKTEVTNIIAKAKVRRQAANARRAQRLASQRAAATSNYLGKKRCLIILVNFTDKKFKSANNQQYYERIANEEGFSEGRFKGSIKDYFIAQSLGKFEIDFDVVGPVTVAHPYSYYGQNDQDGNDKRPAEMVIEAVKLAKEYVTDWKQYDWDNSGEVNQVYFIYAGQGEADTDSGNTIWPHAYDLYSANYYGDGSGPVKVDNNLVVSTYACGPELSGNGSIEGIGTICHEFSHCLGYPDYYDIDYSGGWGMDVWDLMSSGSYNGDGFQPAGYTSYERWEAGWTQPILLEEKDVKVENMQALQETGESYVIYNKRNLNEFFLLENRQKVGWDASLPGKGLLILHVDYNASVWEDNKPNDDPNRQRMTWMPADNKFDYEYYQGEKYLTEKGLANDPFPYKTNNKFNKDTKPAAKFYNKNYDGTYFMDSSVEDITQNADGTISFSFIADYDKSSQEQGGEQGGETPEPYVKPTVEGALFYESFDQCDGKGGNDEMWSGQIANSDFLTDNSGWTAEKGYGANGCAKFGTSSVIGSATTPAFAIDGEAMLSFKAGAWSGKSDGTVLNVTAQGATTDPVNVTLVKGAFTNYEVKLNGKGNVRIIFLADKGRFFLDEVMVKPSNTDAIHTLSNDAIVRQQRIYTLDGRYVGTDFSVLRRGIYLINGRKIVR